MASNSLLSPAVDEWIIWRANAQGVTKGTSKVDAVHLRRFLGSVGNIQCRNLTNRHVERAMAEATTLNWRSHNQYADRLRSFNEFLHLRGYLSRTVDLLAGWRSRKGTPAPPRHLHPSKFPALLEAAGNPRDRALIACGLYLFTRQSETARLLVADVDLAAGTVAVTVTKSNLTDLMTAPVELLRELRAWLTQYTQLCGPLDPNWFLFPSRIPAGTPERKPSGAWLPGTAVMLHRPTHPIHDPGVVTRAALDAVGFPTKDASGVPLRQGSHTLRRSGARAWYDVVSATNPRALKIVSARLHHKSTTTTEDYLGVQAERVEGSKLLAGRPMFPEIDGATVTRLHSVSNQ